MTDRLIQLNLALCAVGLVLMMAYCIHQWIKTGREEKEDSDD